MSAERTWPCSRSTWAARRSAERFPGLKFKKDRPRELSRGRSFCLFRRLELGLAQGLGDSLGIEIDHCTFDRFKQQSALTVHKEGGREGDGLKIRVQLLRTDQAQILGAGVVKQGPGKLRLALLVGVVADADDGQTLRLVFLRQPGKLRQFPPCRGRTRCPRG